MAKNLYALDISFDWDIGDELQYNFSQRSGALRIPSTWKTLSPSGETFHFDQSKGPKYLRIAIWGQHVFHQEVELKLCLDFTPGKDAPKQKRTSPFNRHITSCLKRGLKLGKDDAFYSDGSNAVWIVNPSHYGLEPAGLKELPGSALWFNYFHKMKKGCYELKTFLEVERTVVRKVFCFDPEMEVGPQDHPPQEEETGGRV